MKTIDWIVVGLYFLFMLAVGLYFTRRASRSMADYFVSGRDLPWWIIALSAVRNCVRAGAWYVAIEPDERHIAFVTLMNTMLAGEAIKYLTATGPLLAEPAKADSTRIGRQPLDEVQNDSVAPHPTGEASKPA